MPAQHHRLIIVGSGPAGYTAAVYAARAALTPVIITGVEVGGQMTTTTDVDNWPGDDEGVMGPELMERMKRHAERFGTKLIHNHVDRVELEAKAVPVVLRQGRVHLRRLDRRDGRLGEVPRLADGGSVQGPRRIRVRDVRRVLLPQPTGRRHRRRQHGRRGGVVPLEHRLARHARAQAQRVPRRADHDRQARRAQPNGQRRHPLRSRARGGARRRSRRHGRPRQAHEEGHGAKGRRARRVHRDRPHAEHGHFPGSARDGGRLHRHAHGATRLRHGNERRRRLRRRRRRRPGLSPGRDVGGLGLHGGARRRALFDGNTESP